MTTNDERPQDTVPVWQVVVEQQGNGCWRGGGRGSTSSYGWCARVSVVEY